MRNLAIRLVLWLCRRFDIALLAEARLHMTADAVQRSERWEAFYAEEGGLADMLADIRKEAFEAAQEIDPRDTDKIYYWAMADRNVRKLEQRVKSVVMHGKLEAERRRKAELLSTPRPRKSVY